MRWESLQERQDRDGWWGEAMTDPQRAEKFRAIHAAVVKGDLTLAQVGGFSPAEIDSAHAGACKLLQTGRPDEALQIAGYLILLSPWEARHYYLAGLCFHRRREYPKALPYYEVALAFGDDGVTLVTQGEAHLMLGEHAAARRSLARGLKLLSPNDDKTKAHRERATALLATYLGGNDGGHA